MHRITATTIALALVPAMALAQPAAHQQAADRVAGMVSDGEAQAFARQHGLSVVNVMWEDTGRWQGSSVGPNISDVTIEVESQDRRGQKRTHLMPVLRYPNFGDTTADVRLDEFFVRIGNERGGELRPVSLRDLLSHPGRYMSLPHKGHIEGGSLLAERDTHALVSAQHAFLPIRGGGSTRFWPVIFNYQSRRGHPAVLSILATRQGTSMTIIDNSRDTVRGSRGQRLYFNKDGERAPLLAERLSDVQSRGVTANNESAASLGDDANVLLLIQVPLKVSRPEPQIAYEMAPAPMASGGAPSQARRSRGAASDVEVAVVGHGPTEGPYTELDGLTIERDPRFPVRVTVQFYQATSNGVVSSENVSAMAAQIGEVYRRGDYVGSLVVPDRADLQRPTNWDGVSGAPPHVSWLDFPGLVERYHDLGWRPLRRVFLAR
jgi:hypothetical protein